MDIFVIAAWSSLGSFLVAVAGLILEVWRRRQDKKKRPPE
jgi:hypothetical protein